MSANFDPPSVGHAVGIDFDLIGMPGCVYHYLLPATSMKRYRTAVVDNVDQPTGSKLELCLALRVNGRRRGHQQARECNENRSSIRSGHPGFASIHFYSSERTVAISYKTAFCW